MAVVLLGATLLLADKDAPDLRQGKFFTEDEGRRELDRIAKLATSKAEWEARAAKVREGIIDGAGLRHALEKRGPLKPVVHSKRDHDGYSVENIAIESLPGYFATGNLYRPLSTDKKHPAVICVHGHFKPRDRGGRFRPDMQTRCATLARAGAVVLSLDMVGWGESTQYPHEKKALALQILNGVRAVDYLASRDDVDATRIGITGASGGGTQSFLITAIEPRITVSVPTVMVAAHFFGGCDCESGLPIHVRESHITNNAEIAALAAPRPQMLISCGADWTKNTPYVEFPYLKRIYGFHGEKDKVENLHLAEEKHDYGESKRRGAYRFFAKHLGLPDEPGFDESKVTIEPPESLLVFDDDHPRPSHALTSEEAIEKLLAPKRNKPN